MIKYNSRHAKSHPKIQQCNDIPALLLRKPLTINYNYICTKPDFFKKVVQISYDILIPNKSFQLTKNKYLLKKIIIIF